MRQDSKTYAAIAKKLSIPASTIKSIIKKEHDRGHVHSEPLAGRQRKTDEQLECIIVHKAKKNRRMTAAAIAEEERKGYSLSLTPSTVRNWLYDTGLNGGVAPKKP